VGSVGVIAFGALIAGDAQHSGADGLPGPFGQGDGGEGFAVHRSGVVNCDYPTASERPANPLIDQHC